MPVTFTTDIKHKKVPRNTTGQRFSAPNAAISNCNINTSGQAKSRGWVGRGWMFRGSWVVGRGSCLLEDKKKYISSLSARSKFAIARSRINVPELLSFMKR